MVHKLQYEWLGERICLSSATLAVHNVVVPELIRPVAIQAADIDADGDTDLFSVSGTFQEGVLAWHENVDGQGNFAPLAVISRPLRPGDATLADLDGDGDQDVISATSENVTWYENKDGRTFGEPREISDFERNEQILAIDVDADGDLDVVSSRRDRGGEVHWFENLDGRGTWSAPIRIAADNSDWLSAGDLDSDGDLDVIGDTGSWYENPGEEAPNALWSSHPLPDPGEFTAADLDGDGDADLVGRYANRETVQLKWFANTDGRGNFRESQVIDEGAGVGPITVSDLDGDGDMDVLSAFVGLNLLAWYENVDGAMRFGERIPIPDDYPYASSSVDAADLNGDGRVDAITSSQADNSLGWFPGIDSVEQLAKRRVILLTDSAYVFDLELGDLDGDQDLDIASASSRLGFGWYENTNGNGLISERRRPIDMVSGRSLDRVPGWSVDLFDLDADGDLDLLTHELGELEELAWYENNGGVFRRRETIDRWGQGPPEGKKFAVDADLDGDLDVFVHLRFSEIVWYEKIDDGFGPRKTIQSEQSIVVPGDLDQDGDPDLLIVGGAGGMRWLENTDGQGTFDVTHVIAAHLGGQTDPFLLDLDGDSDLDIFTPGQSGWFENQGDGQFGLRELARRSEWRYPADVDGDGDIDFVGRGRESLLAWFENLDGLGNFSEEKNIIRGTPNMNVTDALVRDFDGDGDADVVTVTGEIISLQPLRGLLKVIYYENQGESFSRTQLFERVDDAPVVLWLMSGDMDGDGDADLLTASEAPYSMSIKWYEDRIVGDSNKDGRFDTRDLVAVFAAGEYEDQRRDNSSFDEGDWNGDGDFTSADLVFAFQRGAFTAMSLPRRESNRIAAAIDELFDMRRFGGPSQQSKNGDDDQ